MFLCEFWEDWTIGKHKLKVLAKNAVFRVINNVTFQYTRVSFKIYYQRIFMQFLVCIRMSVMKRRIYIEKYPCKSLVFSKIVGNFIWKNTLAQLLSCEFLRNFEEHIFYRTPAGDCFWLSMSTTYKYTRIPVFKNQYIHNHSFSESALQRPAGTWHPQDILRLPWNCLVSIRHF